MQPALPMSLPLTSWQPTVHPGDVVGAGRIPFKGNHPRCWGLPWTGVVLSLDDPEAWAGSLAFPEAEPEPFAVSEHVHRCLRLGILRGVPVRWEFGRVCWEDPARLRSVAADREAFEQDRLQAMARER